MRFAWAVLCIVFAGSLATAGDTFSIVAVDTVTGEIGSAGASCVGPINGIGAYILSDVIEGVGAIHTQASWLASNQQTAHNQMLLGKSPQEIIDWMVTHDAQGNPTVRQYGIVDLTRRGASAAYTGVNCTDYKNHVTGPGYSVQGNILLGQVIIDTITNVFLRTTGPLADRMMRALEAAKIVGADTRCASRGTSSESSFITVVRIGDGAVPYLRKIVPDSPVNVDPIDLLRTQFNLWKDSLRTFVDPFLSRTTLDRDTLIANGTSQAVLTIVPRNNSDTLLSSGRRILLSHTGAGAIGPVTDLGNGTYVATITAPSIPGIDTIKIRVTSGPDTVRLAAKPTLVYVNVSSIGEDPGHATRTPEGFRLEQNYPNPFNPHSTISFVIPTGAYVALKVFGLSGQVVLTLAEGEYRAGAHRVSFDGSKLGSGVYYYQLRAGSFVITRKMLLLK
jgi:uncharacterized Ntn-hydrolase superfamily protein